MLDFSCSVECVISQRIPLIKIAISRIATNVVKFNS
jgi:hypothetical protein